MTTQNYVELGLNMPLYHDDFIHLLPHREPFLLVDRIDELRLTTDMVGSSVKASKSVSVNEPVFAGHFPDKKIYPGVYIAEGIHQAAALLAPLYITHVIPEKAKDPESLYTFLAGIEKAKFRQFVLPGSLLRYEVEVEKSKRGFCKSRGKAFVEDTLVYEVSFNVYNPALQLP